MHEMGINNYIIERDCNNGVVNKVDVGYQYYTKNTSHNKSVRDTTIYMCCNF